MFALVESFITGSVTDALGELSSLGKESSTAADQNGQTDSSG